MSNKYLPYNEYWNLRGEYGRERVKRKNERKQKRKEKRNTSCKCGHNAKTPYLHSCPFAEDMHGDYTKQCRCCSDCAYQCAMDI